MNRPTAIVLLLTFFALVGATLWVPVRPISPPGFPLGDITWRPCWAPLDFAYSGALVPEVISHSTDFAALALELVLILVVGGLLALALHTRARRRQTDFA